MDGEPSAGWHTKGKRWLEVCKRRYFPRVAPLGLESQCGGVPKKGPREAVIGCQQDQSLVPRRHSSPKFLAAVRFHLDSAFDRVDRATAVTALAANTQLVSLKMFLHTRLCMEHATCCAMPAETSRGRSFQGEQDKARLGKDGDVPWRKSKHQGDDDTQRSPSHIR